MTQRAAQRPSRDSPKDKDKGEQKKRKKTKARDKDNAEPGELPASSMCDGLAADDPFMEPLKVTFQACLCHRGGHPQPQTHDRLC